MNILFNLSALKAGGGQNVAMNFLYSYVKNKFSNDNSFFLVAKDSEPCQFLSKINYPNFLVVPNNPIKRILFEVFLSYKYLKENEIDIIYSYFGSGLFPKKFPQVTGSADSNLYFPEIDFWSDYKGFSRVKKWIVDKYRLWGVRHCQAVVFENEALEVRAKTLYKIKKTISIKPSINFDFENIQYHLPSGVNTVCPKGLFLCGWHPNKNYQIIPEVASLLKARGEPFHFLITAPIDNSSRHEDFKELIQSRSVMDYVSIIGRVRKNELQSLYEQVDFVFLLSKLESFSNNIIESWFFKKPLIVSDAIWARTICGDAALYVKRDSAHDIANKIQMLIKNKELEQNIVQRGICNLKEYPSIEGRINQEMEFLKNVYETA